MRERRAIGIFLLFSALVLLTTCQLQFNKSTGNSLALRIIAPANSSVGARSTPALGTNAKDLGGGTSLTVMITAPNGSQQTVSTSIGGKTSIDFSFTLTSSGTYQVSANMLDGSGSLLSTASTQLTVPTGNYPVILKMPSNLLSAVLTSFGFPLPLTPPFSPTIYSYSVSPYVSPYTLTLTTVDPNATITSVTENGNAVLPSSQGVYTFNDSTLPLPVIIVVTAADGTTTETYTVTL
jgi:hypothetical protein